MNDQSPRLGRILTKDEVAFRDAIHIAVTPAVAGEELRPGERVYLIGEVALKVIDSEPVGIVDPFLPGWVHARERFWMVLMPGTVTGMRHHWQHPLFMDGEGQGGPDWEIVKRTADACGRTVKKLMADAEDYADDEECYIGTGEDEGYKNADWQAFWAAYGRIKGVEPKRRFTPYACCC